MGQYEEMETALQAVQRLDPQQGVVPLIRGDRYASEGRYADAIREFEHAMELDAERIGPEGHARLREARRRLQHSGG